MFAKGRCNPQRFGIKADCIDTRYYRFYTSKDAFYNPKTKENLLNKLEELKAEFEPTRLEQEVTLLAQKADVDEELDRLNSHLQEVKRVLDSSGQIGRRLDFLMQELNREANTLSSKSIVVETTQNAVELKVLIEQMREQIQNIE